MYDLIEVDCDLCGGSERQALFTKEGFSHVRCRDCGMVYVSPRLKGHLDSQESSGTGAMGDEKLSRSQVGRLRKELKSCESFRKLNRILEVGAGRGWFLREAAAAGWETWAVEVNRDALEWLSSAGLSRILVEPAEDFQAPAESVDVIRMWDVIEHLESPRTALLRISGALRTGGLLRISTTNFASLSRMINGPEWVYLNGSDHIHLFEPRTISSALTECGFDNVRIRTRSFNLRRKLYHPEKILPTRPWWLVPLRKVIDQAVGLTQYGHQMIVTATKSQQQASHQL